jgi:autotransporter-associated beta strand protein
MIKEMKFTKIPVVVTLSISLLLGSAPSSFVSAQSVPTNVDIAPAPAWGYFVDQYKNNTGDNKTMESNPSIGILSGFNALWKAGTSWNTGIILNEDVLGLNILKVYNQAKRRTVSEEKQAYLDDRRNQSYSVIEGLGAYTDVYRNDAKATTTIQDVAVDATTKKYSDEGNNAGEVDSKLGNMVSLVNTLRGKYSSTNPAKTFYSYPRPFRWVNNSVVVPTLLPVQNDDPTKDGGFPSGHTNAAYLSAYALAYAVPERYQELLTRASELGNNRIVAGMHSPLDVIGGRVMATALSAAILSDPENAQLKQAAYEEAHSKLLTQKGTSTDAYTNYEQNKKWFNQRLTYGFKQNKTVVTNTSVVPKGAEVLLETRLPYLSATERRWVLATTALPAGYPVLDDPEGWGRLNLFSAADGFGAFLHDVTVNMDASKGSFNAKDQWRNDITGSGKLTKQGTGVLGLNGNNTYTGGTFIEQGGLIVNHKSALGSGNVTNTAGTLKEAVSGQWYIEGNYNQSAKAGLELNIASTSDQLVIKKHASLSGKLSLNFTNKVVPENGQKIISFEKRQGSFSSIEIIGVPKGKKVDVIYTTNSIQLKVTNK